MLQSHLERLTRRWAIDECRTEIDQLRKELKLNDWKFKLWLFITGKLKKRKEDFANRVNQISIKIENKAMKRYNNQKVYYNVK